MTEEAPEWAWLKLRGVPKIYGAPCDDMPLLEPYVRADIHKALEAERDKLKAKNEMLWKTVQHLGKTNDKLSGRVELMRSKEP